MSEGRIALVLGTRPEIIKLAGLARELGDGGFIVHSGQHYDASLSKTFFDTYGLSEPEIELKGVGGSARGDQFAAIISQLSEHFSRERPSAVVVQGDTNTAAAAAQAGAFLEIPVVHVEAGLRSYDRAMPEEINRQLIGVVAELHCAPTELAASQLRAEGIDSDRILVTGNTVVEATLETLPSPGQRHQLLAAYGLVADTYLLATIHRPENTDDPRRLEYILGALAALDLEIVLPLHPRTRGCIDRFGLRHLLDRIRVVDPIDHPTFLALARHARLLVSDSGGVQEECTVLKRPLLVLRNSTERPEAVDAGFARRLIPDEHLVDVLPQLVANGEWCTRLAGRPSPYGDGTASVQIAKATLELIGR